eukprot:COSAG02_NODE_835_length_16654_cov_52.747569_6_plen_397_part_00
MRRRLGVAVKRLASGDVPITAVPLLVGCTATLCVVGVSAVRSRRSQASDASEEIKLPSEMSVGERLLARLRGRGPGNTARPDPAPQLAAATASRIARQQNMSISSGRAVGSEIFGNMGSGLVFSGDQVAVEQEADISAEVEAALAAAAVADSTEEGMAATNAAQQRRMLLYPLMLFMMMPLWPWAYAYGSKPLVSAERAASWGQKAQQYGSGAANRWAKGRLSTHFEEYHKQRAKNAAEAQRMRSERYDKAYRSGYTHYHGKSADGYEQSRRGKTASAGDTDSSTSGASQQSRNSEWGRMQRRMREQARQRAQQQYRAQKQQREQARRDAAGANLMGFKGDMEAVTETELRAAWRKTATRLHPDMNPPEEAALYSERFAAARATYEETCRRRGLTP